MSKRLVCLLISVVLSLSLCAQENDSLQPAFLEAEYFLMNEDYADALNGYLQIYEKMPDNANIAYCIGVCYLNINGKKNLAVSYLEAASKNMSAMHKEGTLNEVTAPYDALFYLATAYRINYKFDKARETLIKYSGTLLPDDNENLDFINHEIEVCDMAKKLIAKPVSYSEGECRGTV